jgi:hypothetical protein
MGDSCYLENQVVKLSEIVEMILSFSREEVFEKMIESFSECGGFIDGEWADYRYVVEKE